MNKIKAVKIKNEDGSISEESYNIAIDAVNVDMANGRDLQDTIGEINVDSDGSVAEQLKHKIDMIYIEDNLTSTDIDKALSANQGRILNDKLNKTPYYYNTVADMKTDTKLKAGDMAITLGYYEANDGGAGEYQIISGNYSDDGGSYHELNNELFAELIIKNGEINAKQFGAYGDGIHNDTDVLRTMFNSCRENEITSFYFPKGSYYVTNTILDYGIPRMSLRGANDDMYDGATIFLRGADVTVFNFGGTMTLAGRSYIANVLYMKNITFRDKATTYINNVFATLHYTMHFTIENCSFSCSNKTLDLKHCYDSRFINCDFTSGGNTNDAMITLHGAKHASLTEIGWDSANCISFIGCRFERYFGTAIRTVKEEQPSEINPNYDPYIAGNVNTLWFTACRFEAPTCTTGKHLDFNYTSSIFLDIRMTILDGQPNLQPIYFNNCSSVYGSIQAGYNQTTVGSPTYSNFEQPMIILYNSHKVAFDLIVGTVYEHYLLDYFVDITANDASRRAIDINLIYNGKAKKLYRQTINNQTLNTYKQGRETRYGQYENGFGLKPDNTVYNEFYNNAIYDNTNGRYEKREYYKNSNNENQLMDTVVAVDNFNYHRYDSPVLMNNSLMIKPNIYPSSIYSPFRGSSSTSKAIMYGNNYPQSEQTDVLFKAGDIIFNTAPIAGGKIGWVCISGGNPGTWKSFGNIEN